MEGQVGTKLSPYEAFVDNIEDAKALMSYARAFKNKRNRRMRQELRSRVGDALKVPVNRQEDLDCLESDDLFVVFMPDGDLSRDRFTDLQPLLRQSLVAACAALETYVADKAMEFVGATLDADDLPSRMKSISLTVGRWAEIEKKYTRRRWGIRSIIDEYIRETSSTASSNIGIVLSTIGVDKWSTKVDRARNVSQGTTVKELDEITRRRNLIAHTADRKGLGRASVKPGEVERQLLTIEDAVCAIEEVLGEHQL